MKIRRILACVLAAAMAVSSLAGCGAGEEENTFETAKEAIRNMKTGISIGNTLDATDASLTSEDSVAAFETAWQNPAISPTVVANLAAEGFGAVRIPVTWNRHFDKDGNIDEAWMARIEEVVNYVLDNGMYCIINMHHDTGESYAWIRADAKNYEINHEKVEKIWTNIAERFKDYDDKLLFEGFNEMLNLKSDWNNPSEEELDVMNQWNQLFVDTVRATGGNNATRNLIVNTYAASTTEYIMNGFVLPTDTVEDHLMAEVHCYEPWGFTSTTATWTTMTDVFDEAGEAEVDAAVARVKARFVDNDIPVILGEYGCEIKKNDEERAKYASYVVKKFGEIGVTCFYWDNGTNMEIMGRYFAESRHKSVADAIIAAANEKE